MYSALHHIKTLMFGAVIYYNGSKFGCWRFPAVPFPPRAGSLDGLWMLSWMLLHQPWVSNHFPLDMPNMPSPFPSSPLHAYMNHSFGYGGTMTPLFVSSFDRSHIPQPNLTMGGCNLPSYGSNPSHDFSGANSQMGGYYTYYTPSLYPPSAMPVPTNSLPMASPHTSCGISYGRNKFYYMGYPLHGTLSHGGNIYPHLTHPYHTFVSFQTFSSVMMLVQTSMDQLGRRYYLSG
jgi:hypothetical protein